MMILIGEKLNGSIPAVADAIARRDESVLRARARAQADAGADYLDICASVDVSVEADTLHWMIDVVQSETGLPLCIDSPNADALVAMLPRCRCVGLVNSVSLEGSKIDTIFPAIQDTDWKCIALLCDDNGIPATVAARMDVLEKLMLKADMYRIAHERLFIDPLVTALSTTGDALITFTECVREIRHRYPDVHITSGLSNISFGLPARKYINQAFLTLAIQSGMDSAIMDPTNRDMRALLSATEALLGHDEMGIGYIAAAERDFITPANTGAPAPVETAAVSALTDIREAVASGKHKEIGDLVGAALLSDVDPNAILNEGMIAAMSEIGERFSRGEAFVPEMLIAARTMKKGVERLKPSLAAGATGACGKIVIGTVAGDLHDIGKNLVALMLESTGFTVLDLGVDVSAKQFLDAIEADPDIQLVALSTLLTTTMPAMQEIVRILRAQSVRPVKILVGGAPVTEAFASAIGADAYSADAASAAVTAKALVGASAR